MPKIPQQKNKIFIIEKILEFERNPNGANNNIINNNNDNTNLPELKPLVAILRQSFLRPQQPKSERSAARIGHKNEEKFLREFWEFYNGKKLDLPENFNALQLNAIFRPGLVARKGDNSFVKDSADGVMVFKKNDEVSGSLFFFSYFFVYELTCSYFYDGRLGIGFHPLKLKAAYRMTVENVQKHGSRTIWGLKSTIPQQGITFNYVPMTNLCIY